MIDIKKDFLQWFISVWIKNLKELRLKQLARFTINQKKNWLKTNNTDIYLTNNDKNLVVTEQFIRTLKNKTYK